MTVSEYVTGKFGQFGITVTDADLADISTVVNIGSTYTEDSRMAVYRSLVQFVIPHLLLRPRSVNEHGFGATWDNEALMKYYAWLCELTGEENVLGSSITDISEIW